MIAQADTVAGQVQRCQRVEEAGDQTAQTAVAQRRFRLHLFDIGKALADGSQCIAGFIVQSQIDEVVGQQLADKKFGTDVVKLAAGDALYTVGTFLSYEFQQSQVQLLICTVSQRLARETL